MTDRIKHAKRALGGVACGDMSPQENFWFQTWDRFWCCFGVKHICVDLLSTREGGPSKGGGGVHLYLPYPTWIRHWNELTPLCPHGVCQLSDKPSFQCSVTPVYFEMYSCFSKCHCANDFCAISVMIQTIFVASHAYLLLTSHNFIPHTIVWCCYLLCSDIDLWLKPDVYFLLFGPRNRVSVYVIDEYVLSLQEADAVGDQKAANVQL